MNLEHGLFLLIQLRYKPALLDLPQDPPSMNCSGLAFFARGSRSAIQVSWVWIAAGETWGSNPKRRRIRSVPKSDALPKREIGSGLLCLFYVVI